MLKKIVIVEDNTKLVEFITDFLKSTNNFIVNGYTSGVEALKNIKMNKPDLVLVDLELEDVRGETICAELRKEYVDLPIIILTGDKSQSSIVNGLNLGADDYITKPFNADELLARINARLRKAENLPSNSILTAEDLTLDMQTLEVKRGPKKINLTAKEFELLKYLMINKSHILTRDKILNTVWGYDVMIDTRVVDVHIGKLRKKIDGGFKNKLLKTIRGFGYQVK